MILAVVAKLKFKWRYLLLAVFSMCIFLFPKHINLFHISRTFGLMVFVIIGLYAKKYAILNRPVKMLVAYILALILLSAGLFFMDMWRYYMPLHFFNFVTATLISYSLIFYCKQFDQIKIPLFKTISKVLAFCGRHSLIILSFQAILGLRFFVVIKNYTHITNAYVLMLAFVLSCFTLTYILSELKIQYKKVLNE